jgi:hypothetical protein
MALPFYLFLFNKTAVFGRCDNGMEGNWLVRTTKDDGLKREAVDKPGE